MEEKIGHSISSLVDILYKVHSDNSKQQYYAEKAGRRMSTMPLTPFIYEFFLFNSLYQVDWNKSYDKEELIFHPDDYSESKQQRALIKYLKSYSIHKPADFYRAFEPLVYLPTIEGEWTHITPDARISKEHGVSFFEKIRELQNIVESCKNQNEMLVTKKVFELIDKGVYYIYLVRNNIFHGSKTLGEVYERNQKRRIEVYELFLKGVTSLFFLAAKKPSVASDFIPCPITSSSLPISQDIEMLDQNTIWSAINKQLIKIGDTRLIAQFTKQIEPPKIAPSNRSALFYPSSGSDMLTPILLGLPYCTQFYFYERGQVRHAPQIQTILNKIPTVKFDDCSRLVRWNEQGNEHCIGFEYDGIPRKIHWIHADNLEFLESDVDLRFYFHRGDSWGEGGSGQQWDSEHLPKLISMVPDNQICVFLTDGEPGGVNDVYFETCSELNMPFLERGRKYYYGTLSTKRA